MDYNVYSEVSHLSASEVTGSLFSRETVTYSKYEGPPALAAMQIKRRLQPNLRPLSAPQLRHVPPSQLSAEAGAEATVCSTNKTYPYVSVPWS